MILEELTVTLGTITVTAHGSVMKRQRVTMTLAPVTLTSREGRGEPDRIDGEPLEGHRESCLSTRHPARAHTTRTETPNR